MSLTIAELLVRQAATHSYMHVDRIARCMDFYRARQSSVPSHFVGVWVLPLLMFTALMRSRWLSTDHIGSKVKDVGIVDGLTYFMWAKNSSPRGTPLYQLPR